MFIRRHCSECSELHEPHTLVLLDDPVDFQAACVAYEDMIASGKDSTADYTSPATCVSCASVDGGQEWFSADQWEAIGAHPFMATPDRIAEEWMEPSR